MRITQEHITAGKAGDCADCAIALAVRDAIGNCEFNVELWCGWMALNFRGFRIKEVKLPGTLVQFQERFDAGRDVVPGEYLWADFDELMPMFRAASQRIEEGLV